MLIKPAHYLPHALLFCLLILNCVGFTHAKEPKWYQIEVLLFAQQPSYQHNTELLRDHFQPNYSNSPISLNPNSRSRLKNNLESNAYNLLPNSEHTLKSAAQRIKASADLRLLTHLAWHQPVRGRKQAQSILIQTGKQFESEFELEGTIRIISRGSYLHARTDLFFSEFKSMESRQNLDWTVFEEDQLNSDQREWSADLNQQASTAKQFFRSSTAHSKQSRRMRSKELHYIDHPQFGMLIQITPYNLL
jgi:hypothetical protein